MAAIIPATHIPLIEKDSGEITRPWFNFLSKAGGSASPLVWIEVLGGIGFQNSWANFGPPYETAGYSISSGDKIVRLKGLIAGGTLTATVFTLPVGFRPAKNRLFSSTANGAAGVLVIDTAGVVTPEGASNAYFSLEDIAFSVP